MERYISDIILLLPVESYRDYDEASLGISYKKEQNRNFSRINHIRITDVQFENSNDQ